MSTNPLEGMTDEFFEQILLMPGYPTPSVATGADSDGAVTAGMMLHIGTGGGFPTGLFPLGHSLDQGKTEETSGSGKRFCNDAGVGKPLPPSLPSTATNNNARESTARLFPPLGNVPPSVRPLLHQTGQGIAVCQSFRPQSTTSETVSHPPMARPKVRARRGQATDPHSIAERLRRERIAERMKQLQELVPNTNKTDRAVMLDEIMDYVKFLRLQVNVLSMSRIGGAGSVTQLVANIPSPTLEMQGESSGASSNQQQQQEVWDKWSADGTERQVAKLMEEDIGAAMQFLQSKDLCLMPLSLAMAMYHTHQPQGAPFDRVKPEPSAQ